MSLTLPSGARVPSSPARPARMAVSYLERVLAGDQRRVCAVALRTARLELAGRIRPAPVDVWFYPRA